MSAPSARTASICLPIPGAVVVSRLCLWGTWSTYCRLRTTGSRLRDGHSIHNWVMEALRKSSPCRSRESKQEKTSGVVVGAFWGLLLTECKCGGKKADEAGAARGIKKACPPQKTLARATITARPRLLASALCHLASFHSKSVT